MTSITPHGREVLLSFIQSFSERDKTQNIHDHFCHYEFSDQYKERIRRIDETCSTPIDCCDKIQELKDTYIRKYCSRQIEFHQKLLHEQAAKWEINIKDIKRSNIGDELTRSHCGDMAYNLEDHLGRISEYVRFFHPEEINLYRKLIEEVIYYRRLLQSDVFVSKALKTGIHALEWGLERYDKWIAFRRASGITDTMPEEIVLKTMFKQIDKHVLIYKDGYIPADRMNRAPPGNLLRLCAWWLYGDIGGLRPPCPVGKSCGNSSDEAVRDFIQFEAPRTPEEYIETFPRYARRYVETNTPL